MQNWQEEVKDVAVNVKHGKFNDGNRYTIALAYDTESKMIGVGVAFVNPLDNFSRKIGNNISRGRALKAVASGYALKVSELTNWATESAEDDFITKDTADWVKRELKFLGWL
jgi:hypothetical protein